MGPGEYFLIKDRMNVRGARAIAPGYEGCNAQHDDIEFPEDSEFCRTFLGPLNFLDDDSNTVAPVGCKQVLDACNASTGGCFLQLHNRYGPGVRAGNSV